MGKREPRSVYNRRSGVDRRRTIDPNYKGLERRSGKDRRYWIDRRSS